MGFEHNGYATGGIGIGEGLGSVAYANRSVSGRTVLVFAEPLRPSLSPVRGGKRRGI